MLKVNCFVCFMIKLLDCQSVSKIISKIVFTLNAFSASEDNNGNISISVIFILIYLFYIAVRKDKIAKISKGEFILSVKLCTTRSKITENLKLSVTLFINLLNFFLII